VRSCFFFSPEPNKDSPPRSRSKSRSRSPKRATDDVRGVIGALRATGVGYPFFNATGVAMSREQAEAADLLPLMERAGRHCNVFNVVREAERMRPCKRLLRVHKDYLPSLEQLAKDQRELQKRTMKLHAELYSELEDAFRDMR
jgi:hypothetical protein